jgi:peptide/nickel transport system substrate-binding protein
MVTRIRACWLPFLSVAVMLALLVACPAFSSAAPAGKKEIIVVQGADIQRMDPHMSTSDPDVKVLFNIYDNLIFRGPDNKLYPGLATEWKNLNDTTWQFKLRRGVKFHNGEPFNAEVAKFSLERTFPSGDPRVMTRSMLSTCQRVDVVDPYTINVITKAPDPLLLDRIAWYGGQIIPKAYYTKVGADEFNAKPVGTGPLKLLERVKDDHTTFEANKDWFGGKLAFERITYKPMPEPAARVAALLKGEADIITVLPPDDIERVEKSANAEAVKVPLIGLYVLATNYKRPFPMDNKEFHKALSLAIDREAIVKDLWRGMGIVPNGFDVTSDWTYDKSRPPLEYDVAKAKELLKKINYKGEEIVLESTSGFMTNDKVMSEAIVAMWKEAGINAKLEIVEFSVRSQKDREKSFKGLWWSNPGSTLNDPDGLIYRLTGPGSAQDYIRIPEYDRLMQEARTTLDRAKRKANYEAAHKIAMDYMWWIPVIQPIQSYGIQKFLKAEIMGNNDMPVEYIQFK